MERKRTPAEIETSVLFKSARRCTLCFYLSRDMSEKRGQLAHLDKDPANDAEDNLVFMCLDHHTLYDSKTSQHKNYTIQEIKLAREKLYEAIGRNEHACAPVSPASESDAQRKLRAILPFKGRTVKLSEMNTGRAVLLIGRVRGSSFVQLLDCTEFSVRIGKTGNDAWSRSIALADIEICLDDQSGLELQERHR
jgi:hypothetical protein